MTRTYRIQLDSLQFDITTLHNRVIQTSSIAAWVMHKEAESVLSYYRKRGAMITEIDDAEINIETDTNA